jgi:hypothetical protein
MATIKSYTDISQSKKMAEILPLESADMYWFRQIDSDYFPPNVESIYPTPLFKDGKEDFNYDTPCWSLAALLSILPDEITDADDVYRNMFFHLKGKYIIQYPRLTTLWPSLLSVEADNPVDACVDMIIKLNELELP